VIWIGFAVELGFVVKVAERRASALRAHWLDVLIVVLTVPFVPPALASLRLLRILRLARLAALGTRAISAERRLTTRKNFRFIALITAVVVAVAGFAVSYADAENVAGPGEGMWWAISTVSTVGYGDVYPETTVGRFLAGALMLVGIGFLSLLTASIAARFVEDDTTDVGEALARIEARLGRLEDQLPALANQAARSR
jgi:voltage-gated potassium channel